MLELYQSETCPYSEKVREKLSELGVSYIAHNPRFPGDEGGDVTNESTHRELTEYGGKDEIPFLVDHARDEQVYGSDEVVDYLGEHYA